jgi:ABC-type transporter Mla subunit MlaD
MSTPPPYPETTDEGSAGPTTGTPRWVKVFGIIALVVVVLFVILLITGHSGEHGPGRHTGVAALGEQR